jgi:hypothetical protein
MEINIGDKIASDDYCAVGVLTQVGDKLMVVGDFGSVEYEDRCADWEHYQDWMLKIKVTRKARGGFWKRLFSALTK